MGAPQGPPLMGRSRAADPCDWRRWGLNPGRVTYTEFEAARQGEPHDSGYIEHFSIGRPRYSYLRLRASVGAGHAYGCLGGNGYVCHFRREIGGWRLEGCRPTWIA